MIDIKFLRENPDAVKENIKKKFQDSKLPLVDEVIELDAQLRKAQQRGDSLRADRNRISKEMRQSIIRTERHHGQGSLNINGLNLEKTKMEMILIKQ